MRNFLWLLRITWMQAWSIGALPLIVRAKHFKDADFGDWKDCPLARAAKEEFDLTNVSERVDLIEMDGGIYRHKGYTLIHFDKDKIIARRHNYDDTIIRVIKLKHKI
jgi:hypothetical protein